MVKSVKIFDTTLRDGEQSPGFSMNVAEKIRMAKRLEQMGVDVIEAGFPVASQGDFEAVQAISAELKGAVVAGLARANFTDIDRAWEAIQKAAKPRIHTFISSSDIHLEHQLKMSRRDVLNLAVRAVKRAKTYTDDVEFSAMDATRSDREYLAQMIGEAIDAGATTVNIPDTTGYCISEEFGEIIRTLKERVPNIDRAVISVHCHNDLGQAVANSLAAVRNGARQVEGAINGLESWLQNDATSWACRLLLAEFCEAAGDHSRATVLRAQVDDQAPCLFVDIVAEDRCTAEPLALATGGGHLVARSLRDHLPLELGERE